MTSRNLARSGVLILALLLVPTPRAVAAQDLSSDSAKSPRPAGRRHAIYVSASDAWVVSAAEFPASYLARAADREIVAPADLGDGQLFSFSIGVPLSPRLLLEGEAAFLDGSVDARTPGTILEVPLDLQIYSARALWWVVGDVYISGGGGIIRFDPSISGEALLYGSEAPDAADTELQGNFGLGAWPRFGGGHFRVELRDYVSYFSPAGIPAADRGLRNDVALLSVVTLGIP